MAITGRSVPNHPIVVTAQGVQVVGTQAIVVSQQPSQRRYVFNKGTNSVGSGEDKQSPQVNPVFSRRPDGRYLRVNTPLVAQGSAEPVYGVPVVLAAPVNRRFLRVYPATVGQGVGWFDTAQPLVVTGRNPKVLAPRPIVLFPNEPPQVPGSPGFVPIVRPGPSPRPTTRPPLVLTGVAGNPTPPAPPSNVAWCAQTPVTGWTAREVTSDWDASDPGTNWLVLTPEEDC